MHLPDGDNFHGNNLNESVKDIPVVFFKRPRANNTIIFPRLGSYYGANLSYEDMGINDYPEKLSYINVKSRALPSDNEGRIRDLEVMLDLTHKWLDIHAGLQCQLQKERGTLPSDLSSQAKLQRDDYRIKVNDTILSEGNCPWLSVSNTASCSKYLDVNKVSFHLDIVKTLLFGLSTVVEISETLEAILKSVANLIIRTKNEIQSHSSWVFFNVFTWDNLTQTTKASIRIVHYNISGKLVEYVVDKNKVEHFQMRFDFFQQEYIFIEKEWKALKAEVIEFLEDYGRKKIRDPVHGEIKPDHK